MGATDIMLEDSSPNFLGKDGTNFLLYSYSCRFSKALLQAAVWVAWEQAIHLGWSREVAREQHAKGGASAFSGGSLRLP